MSEQYYLYTNCTVDQEPFVQPRSPVTAFDSLGYRRQARFAPVENKNQTNETKMPAYNVSNIVHLADQILNDPNSFLSSFVDRRSDSSMLNINNNTSNTETDLDIELEEHIIDKNGEKIKELYVIIHDIKLIELLKEILPDQDLYAQPLSISMENVLCSLQNIKYGNKEKRSSLVKKYIEFIERHNKQKLLSIKSMLTKGKISYDALWYLFSGHKNIVCPLYDEKSAGSVKNVYYDLSSFVIEYESYIRDRDNYVKIKLSHAIPVYSGVKNMTELDVQLLSDEIKEELIERGNKYIKLLRTNEPIHANYVGNILVKNNYNYSKLLATGRIMIDLKGYDTCNKNVSYPTVSVMTHGLCVPNIISSIPNNESWKMYPFVHGYSLSRCKRWGEFSINGISDIVYNDRAYDELYLPSINGQDKKKLITNFILNKNKFVQDYVNGKGAGIVFLLHGPPGVGKTLTAEATAEILHCPLFHISASDVSTTHSLDYSAQLEKIMDLTTRWNAIVLLDEADVFLERRCTFDIQRNAIVSTFLRLLEYHRGIIFLTTNRVSDFDPAIINRVHVKFEYPELSKEGCTYIWNTLLAKLASTVNTKNNAFYKFSDIDINVLSELKLNGRQIRTCLNLALCLSESENKQLNTDYILRVYNMNFFN